MVQLHLCVAGQPWVITHVGSRWSTQLTSGQRGMDLWDCKRAHICTRSLRCTLSRRRQSSDRFERPAGNPDRISCAVKHCRGTSHRLCRLHVHAIRAGRRADVLRRGAHRAAALRSASGGTSRARCSWSTSRSTSRPRHTTPFATPERSSPGAISSIDPVPTELQADQCTLPIYLSNLALRIKLTAQSRGTRSRSISRLASIMYPVYNKVLRSGLCRVAVPAGALHRRQPVYGLRLHPLFGFVRLQPRLLVPVRALPQQRVPVQPRRRLLRQRPLPEPGPG